MKIHIVHPYDPTEEKNLGKSYNEAFENVAEDDWVCLMDWDVMFLTHDAIKRMYEYVKKYPDTGIFTCWTNRLHRGAIQQVDLTMFDENHIREHIKRAKELIEICETRTTELYKHISGFLMLISKKTWNEIKFNEDGKCLGVDNEYSDRILQSGKKILRMDSIYALHLYRMGMSNDYKDKSHLL